MTPPVELFALVVEHKGTPMVIAVHCDREIIETRVNIYKEAQHLGAKPVAWCCRFELMEAEEVKANG